jgi:predicted transposase/invertase (TIGR01784 family)
MALEDKYINPLTDFGFKKLFGEEVNKDLLIDFLNQLLPKKHKIKDLTYQSSEQLPSHEYDRKAIFDLYCESESGEKFIVELQRAKQNYFKDRSVYYASFPIQQQAIRGSDWDFKLEAVYTIGILDFVFEESKEDTDYIHTVQLKDQKNKVFYDKLTFIYIELPKFKKGVDSLKTKIEKWLFVFRHLARLQDKPQALQEKVFQRLFSAAEIAKYSKEEQQLYEDSLKYYRDLKNVVDTAFEDGEINGMIKRNYEVAKEMKADAVPIEKISKYTGLSEEEIENL